VFRWISLLLAFSDVQIRPKVGFAPEAAAPQNRDSNRPKADHSVGGIAGC
jgi:hypothetical protein